MVGLLSRSSLNMPFQPEYLRKVKEDKLKQYYLHDSVID